MFISRKLIEDENCSKNKSDTESELEEKKDERKVCYIMLDVAYADECYYMSITIMS